MSAILLGTSSCKPRANNSATAAAPSPAATVPPSSAPPSSVPATPATPMPDTVRGIVQRVGSEPASVLVLAPAAGSDQNVLALRGAFLAELSNANGLEVMIEGVRTTERNFAASPRGAITFDVRRFFVRKADGEKAVDGVLNVQNGVYFLVTGNGERHDIVNLPVSLRNQIGARVFLVGPLDRTPVAFGVLSERKTP